ncbi:MAG: alkaline phosphatase D family protein, partial [Myxococcota bacterium]|nr:alkaline phosphatase D family protein [Myxococcota bacterium]
GDYIYETTGDALFQAVGSDRSVSFTDEAGAIPLGDEGDRYYAARSLDNYRELYKIYRSDPYLQRMHERAAMVAVWDDHEFSDDAWGTHGTYHDGREDEDDPERRQNADRAWFEYMPVDYPGDPDFVYEAGAAPFPDDMRIYRDLSFGQHLHLVMTDLRRYRSDHLIAEDGFPGAVAVTQGRIMAALGELPDILRPYVDIETFGDGAYAALLTEQSEALGLDPAVLTGPMSVDWLNGQLGTLNEGLDEAEAHTLISEEAVSEAERGVAYHHLFKTNAHSSLGARYLVTGDYYDILAAVRWAETDGASETAMGEAQRSWFVDTITQSTRTWKVWGNEFVFMPHGVDLREFSFIPDAFRVRFYLSAEDWDGMPNRRSELLAAIGQTDNVVAVTGDIHSFFAGVPSEGPAGLVEFVTGAVSSSTYRTLLVNQAESDPDLVDAGVAFLAGQVGDFMTSKVGPNNPHMAHQGFDKQGCMTIALDGEHLDATLWAIAEEESSRHFEGDDLALDALFERTTFRVNSGEHALYKDVDGTWLRWDVETMEWV